MKITGNPKDLVKYHCREENYYFKQGTDLADVLSAKGIVAQTDQPLNFVTLQGQLCETLGYKSGQEISEQGFLKLLEGCNTNGEQVSRKHKVHGIDLTFSAPKTVSIAGLVMKDGTQQAIIYAHQRAVEETMKEVEKFAYGRLTSITKDHTGKMVWVQVQDGFSREKDPHLHTHCIVMNLTEVNGKVVALDGREIMKRDFNQKMGAVYRMKLAERLHKDIGLNITYTKAGEWQLDRISVECEYAFSKRRQQILEAKGDGMRDMDAWRKTRKDKDPKADKGDIMADWQRTLRETNTKTEFENKREREAWRKDWSETAAYSIEAEQERTIDRANISEDQRWQLALRRATQNEATATKETIIHQYLCECMRDEKWNGVDLSVIEYKLEEQVKQGKIVQVDNHYTSWEMIRTEREYIEAAGERIFEPVNPTLCRDAREELGRWQGASERKLSEAQWAAADKILASDNMITVVQGDAGAGKTTALKSVADIYKERGVQVIGVCMQGVAAQNLEDETGVRSFTLKTYLSPTGIANEGERKEGKVIIFDEASMLDSRNAAKLFEMAKQRGDKVVLVGDRNQLESISSGRVFDRLVDIRERQGKLIEMNENYRQRDEELKEAVGYARQGKMKESLDILDKRGDIVEIENVWRKDESIAKNRREAVAEHYNKDTLIIAGTGLARDELNSIIRAKLTERGELNIKKERTYELVRTDTEGINQKRNLKLTEGDIITFTKNEYKEYNIRNGERAKITKLPLLNKHIIIVETEDKRHLEIDTKKYKNIDYGYALTTYKAQGQTYNKVVIEADTSNPSVNDMRSSYVNITRARDSVKIYTDDKESLKDFAEILTHKRDTLDKIDITLEQAIQSEERLKERAIENIQDKEINEAEMWHDDHGVKIDKTDELKQHKENMPGFTRARTFGR